MNNNHFKFLYVFVFAIITIFSNYFIYLYGKSEDFTLNQIAELLGVLAEIGIIFLLVDWIIKRNENNKWKYMRRVVAEHLREDAGIHYSAIENLSSILYELLLGNISASDSVIINSRKEIIEDNFLIDELQYMSVSFTPEMSISVSKYMKTRRFFIDSYKFIYSISSVGKFSDSTTNMEMLVHIKRGLLDISNQTRELMNISRNMANIFYDEKLLDELDDNLPFNCTMKLLKKIDELQNAN